MEQVTTIIRFDSRPLTAGEYIELFRTVMEALQSFDPFFRTMYSWGSKPTHWTELTSDYSNFEETLMVHIYDNQIVYQNDDGSKGYNRGSRSFIGFSDYLSNTRKKTEPKYSVSLSAGKDNRGSLCIEFSNGVQDRYLQRQYYENLLVCLQEVLPVIHLEVLEDVLQKKTTIYIEGRYLSLGVFNFFRNTQLNNFLPAVVHHKAIGEGCFFWLSEVISDPDPVLIETALSIRDKLIKAGQFL